MGQRQSAPTEDILVKSGRAYKKAHLKNVWAGTDREGYRYKVDYAPNDRSTCRESKTKIDKGTLRVGRMSPSPFDAEHGNADLIHYYHHEHAWKAFLRSRCKSKVPLTTSDLQGFDGLTREDKKIVRKSLSEFKEQWQSKCARNK